MTTVTSVESPIAQSAILRLYDPVPAPIPLGRVLEFFQGLVTIHTACIWLARPLELRRLARDISFWSTLPELEIRNIRLDSLLVELTQAAGSTAGLSAAIWMVARVLREGPGKLYEWGAVLPKTQAEWYRQRADAQQARAQFQQARRATTEEQDRIYAAHESLITIRELAPDLQVSVVDEHGEEMAEPDDMPSTGEHS